MKFVSRENLPFFRFASVAWLNACVLSFVVVYPISATEPELETKPQSTTAAVPDFSAAAKILQAGVEDKAYPGCAVVVGTSRGVLWRKAFGKISPDGAATTTQTLYDLASLTKVVGTTTVFVTLVRDEKLALDDPVAKYLPTFVTAIDDEQEQTRRKKITLESLLTHSAGLSPWQPFHKSASNYDEVLVAIQKTPLATAPGTREQYSDLGFMLLGEIAARAGGKKLPELERERVFTPLGLKNLLRNPPAELLPQIAPTERRPERTDFWHGVVHDENARTGEGVTGHAGLFASADDLAVWAAEWLKGSRGESRILPRELVEKFTRRRELVEGSSRALGWDTPTKGGSAGTQLSPKAFGHTGFTGTSVWLDPTRDVYVLLLSNAVCPQRGNTRVFRIRRELCDAVIAAMNAEK